MIEEGISGLLVPPEDARALADAIVRLSSSPGLRSSLGAAARKRIEEKFNIEREVENHERLYDEIFGSGKRNGVPALGVETSSESLR